MAGTTSPSVKRLPQRTCVACRKVKDKKELIRLVRVSDKSIEVDTGGKKAGRGAYLCRTQECWELGCKGGRVEHNLKTSLTRDNKEELIKFGNELFAGDKEK